MFGVNSFKGILLLKNCNNPKSIKYILFSHFIASIKFVLLHSLNAL